jgi:hypothetical protein
VVREAAAAVVSAQRRGSSKVPMTATSMVMPATKLRMETASVVVTKRERWSTTSASASG